ncbi:neuropeptide Y receptor type 1 [Hydra vulgaris]|uniref:neuropeptide Y receptor type 1 n=1 Tax=Hydra vulgaris TaxID=6087 RepID=UPI001F5FDFCF|nr:neuropeptide Y receptor type 1-like [Hydra vulgaris]
MDIINKSNFSSRSLTTVPKYSAGFLNTTPFGNTTVLDITTPTKLVLYVTYGAILILGIAGNLGILYTLAKRKQPLKKYDIYVISLLVADLLSAIFLPMVSVQDYLTDGKEWYLLGRFGCKVFVPMNHLTMMVSTFMMVIIAVSRLRVLSRTTTVSHYRISAVWKIIVVWSIATASVAPYCNALNIDRNDNSCYDKWSSKEIKFAYYASHQIIASFLPGITLAIVYGISIYKLKRMKIPGENKRSFLRRKQMNKSMMLMFGSIAVIFFILTLPYTIAFSIVAIQQIYNNPVYTSNKAVYQRIIEGLYALSACSAAVNPFVYAYMHKDIKRKMTRKASQFSSLMRSSIHKGPRIITTQTEN